MKKQRRRSLVIREILAWADAFRESTGKWPTKESGGIIGTHFETWHNVDSALRQGLRGLPGGTSLAQLLAEHRQYRNIHGLPPLSETKILEWADDHHRQTGAWPTADSGTIPNSGREKWSSIDVALHNGARGLPGGSSLARLLAQHRHYRNRKGLPPLNVAEFLSWADLYFQRTGTWPDARSGPIAEAPGETWMAVDMALRKGLRGLAGGSSLALVLAKERAVRNAWSRPNLSLAQILAWADNFHQRTGQWPTLNSGPIAEARGETWCAVNHALRKGTRGLPGGGSLARLLAAERGARNQTAVPPLSRKEILAWGKAHHRRTGNWPTRDSGPIAEMPGETWAAVDAALQKGNRGLRGGSSLAKLFKPVPLLSVADVLAWADAYRQRTGKWPNVNSGPVVEAPRERWDLIDNALRQGNRGLPKGSSLLWLLVEERNVRDPLNLPHLSAEQIFEWAKLHFQRTGAWPKYKSGAISDAPGETWSAVDSALRYGKRGLPGQSSLAKLLAAHG
jgi:hypothetical protein